MKRKKAPVPRKAAGNPTLAHVWFTNKAHAMKTISDALEKYGGRVEPAAKALKITKKTLYRYFERYPQLATKWEEIKARFHR